MTHMAAQRIIAEASRDKRIVAELDTRQATKFTRGAGYRVRLLLRPEHRVVTIVNKDDWEPIRDAWNAVFA